MGLPEGYRPRKGDVLIVHVVVEHDHDAADLYVFTKIGYESVAFDARKAAKHIVGVHAYALEIGGEVEFDDDCGVLRALTDDGKWAWVETQSGGLFTLPRDRVRPLRKPPEPPSAPPSLEPPSAVGEAETADVLAPSSDDDDVEF